MSIERDFVDNDNTFGFTLNDIESHWAILSKTVARGTILTGHSGCGTEIRCDKEQKQGNQ